MITEKTLYLIGGPNGSGKTTLAQELLDKHPNLQFMNTDIIQANYNLGQYDAGRMMLQNMSSALKDGKSFVWETTLSDMYHIKVLNRARDAQYKIIFSYIILSSPDQNIARVKQRVALGGHNVDDDIVRRRYYKSIVNFETVCRMADKWILYYNGDKKISEIARGNKDGVAFIANDKNYKTAQVLYDSALNEILELAADGAKHAQRIAARAGVNPVFKHLDTVRPDTI